MKIGPQPWPGTPELSASGWPRFVSATRRASNRALVSSSSEATNCEHSPISIASSITCVLRPCTSFTSDSRSN